MKFLKLAVALLCAQTAFAQFDGYALYNAQNQSTAYLIDEEGDIAYTWSCPTSANYAMALAQSGNIVRGAVYSDNEINGPAVGGMVQELDPNGDVVWEFVYSNSEVVAHHDLCLMPNGNVLLIAWEEIGEDDLIAIGYDDDGDKYATHIIEIQPDGASANIVWEWHIVDHLVQDIDSELPNYGVIAEHPELLDINVETSGGGGPGGGGNGPDDWFHVNGIDYNEELDQIVFSSRYLSEIFIIDHSTNSQEAAGHAGGNSGKGGDFLYRWGNPANYGAPGDQIITAACHAARWIIDDGRPRGGWIQVFNNSGNNGNSCVDVIDAPVDGYNYEYTSSAAYEPASYSYRHECVGNASGQSASDGMSNGNIFVNLSGGQGGAGYMYEVDADDNMIWQYSAGTQKAFRYECDHPGIQVLLENPCESSTDISELDLALNFTVLPNPSAGNFQLLGEFDETGVDRILIYDLMGNLVHEAAQTNSLELRHLANGTYILRAQEGNRIKARKISISKL